MAALVDICNAPLCIVSVRYYNYDYVWQKVLTSKKKVWNLLNTKSPVAVNTKVNAKWTHKMPDLAGTEEAVVYTKFWLKRSGSVCLCAIS
jgi:hypothetical protein